MNQKQKENRKKETGAVVSLLLASSLAFGGCGTAVTSSSSVKCRICPYRSQPAKHLPTTRIPHQRDTDSENAMESASDINFDLELTRSTIDTEFTDRREERKLQSVGSRKITLNKTTATVSGSGVKADGSTITITEEGVYIVSGTLEGWPDYRRRIRFRQGSDRTRWSPYQL